MKTPLLLSTTLSIFFILFLMKSNSNEEGSYISNYSKTSSNIPNGNITGTKNLCTPNIICFDYTGGKNFGLPLDMSINDRISTMQSLGINGAVIWIRSDKNPNDLDAYFNNSNVQNGTFTIDNIFTNINIDNTTQYQQDLALIERIYQKIENTSTTLQVIFRGEGGNLSPTNQNLINRVASIGQLAKTYNKDLIIYPHFGSSFYIETAEEAMGVINQINTDNIFLAVHLTHEIAFGNANRITQVVNNLSSHIKFASISGASLEEEATDNTQGWRIKPLSMGSYDIEPFYRALHDNNYSGPVAIHTWDVERNIGVPFTQHIPESRAILQNMSNQFCNTNAIALPIEVLGNEGVVKQRTLELSSSQANANKIFLMVNNLSYQNKGSIKINGNAWIPLNHNTTQVYAKELAYGGMIHGGMNTIRLTLPANGLREGTNTIQFRFDKSDAISIGYRVIKFNLQDGSGNNLLPESSFVQDNPNTWTAPSGSSVSNGRNLWFNKTLWNRYNLNSGKGFWYAHDGNTRPAFSPNRRQIRAKCADCHTQDGRDLEMFSYSNLSIIERSKFHGLTEQEGKDIAAYIRSLSSEPNVGRYGRPWNPPYQPGPDLANKPIDQWAAGAGLDWVLENDSDMAPYLFGNSITKSSVENYFDLEKMDDRTTIPLSVQFPDWKHWLPIVHPLDAYSRNDYVNNPNGNSKPVIATTNFRNWFEGASEQTIRNEFRNRHWDWYGNFRNFLSQGASNPRHWRTMNSPANDHLGDGVNAEIAATSLARYMAVKNFEFMNEFNLQDKAEWFTNGADKPGARQWPTRKYNVFEVPPHFTGMAYDNQSDAFEGQPKKTGFFESTNWYQLQYVINGGNGLVGGTTPADFNYIHEFIGKTIQASGRDESLRYYSAWNQMYQIRNWSGNNGPASEPGYRIRNQGVFGLLGINHQNSMWYGKSTPEKILEPLNDINPNLAKWVIDAALQQFLDEMSKPKYNLDNWPRYTGDPNANWSGSSIQYMLDRKNITTLRDLPNSGLYQGHFAAKMFYTVKRLKESDASCDLINQVIDWCHSAWPNVNKVGNTTVNGGFNSLRITNCVPDDCEPSEIVHHGVYHIKTRHNKCIHAIENNGYSITQQSCTANDTGKWMLENANTGYYYIKNIASGQYMTTTGANNGDPVQENAFSGNDNQQWEIKEASSCNFNIISKAANKCLDLKSGNSADGTHFQLWTCDNASNAENREYTFELLDRIIDPVISITKNNDATEGVSNASFTVSLDQGTNNSGNPITGSITYSGNATQGADYTAVTSFSIPEGQSSTSIIITVIDDDEVESNETIVATLSNPSLGVISANSSATALIIDTDCESTQIITNAVYKITTKHNKCISSVDFDGHTVTQQTCDNNDDKKWILQDAGSGFYFIKNKSTNTYLYATGITNGSLVEEQGFTGNDNQQWKIIELPDCIFKIDAKTSNLSLDLRRGENIDGNWFQLYEYIEDQNASNKQFSFEFLGMEENNLSVSIAKTTDATEGSSDVKFTISIDQNEINSSGNPITGNITLTGTATQGVDYTNVTTFSIPNGENATVITIPVTDDTEVEETETIIATISNLNQGNIATNTATASITDNDENPVYDISIAKTTDATEGGSNASFTISIAQNENNTSGNPITGNINLTGTATQGVDYTNVTTFSIQNGENATVVTIPVIDDTEVEGIETIIATISNLNAGNIVTNSATATITDNDEYTISIQKEEDGIEGGADAIFTISIKDNLNNEGSSAITGNIEYSGTAFSGTDYSPITSFAIPVGQNSTIVSVPIVDDTEVEEIETIIATIINLNQGILSDNSATASIIDNDEYPEYNISIAKTSDAIEGTSDASFTIRIDQNEINTSGNPITGAITLTGTATQGVDYTNVVAFSIPDGANETLVIIPIIDDTEVEGPETINAMISDLNHGTITNNSATASITDNDVAPNDIVLSIATLSDGSEGNNNVTFGITIDNGLTNDRGTDITGTITLSGTASSGLDYTEINTFAIAPNENGIEITIPVIDDTEIEETETIIATLATTSVGTISSNTNATAFITDNDNCDTPQIIINGVYKIITLNNKCVSSIDLDRHTVTQQTCNDEEDKKWILEDAGNGFYFIKNSATHRYLYASGTTNGSLVEETVFTGEDDQQWKIIELPNCTFKINAKNSDLSMDLRRGEDFDGNWFQLYEYIEDQNAVNKQFTFEFIEEIAPDCGTDIRNNNIYQIKTKHDKSVDASGSGNIHQWSTHGGNNQKWLLEQSGDGYYFIKEMKRRKCMTVENSSENGANIEARNCNEGIAQQWKITLLDNCEYAIQSRATSKCLDLKSGGQSNRTNIQQWSCSESNTNQHFTFELIGNLASFELEYGLKDDVLIFPNPVQDILNIKTPDDPENNNSEVMIYDALGRVLQELSYKESVIGIDISAFPQGNYFIKVIKNKESYLKHFIKK